MSVRDSEAELAKLTSEERAFVEKLVRGHFRTMFEFRAK